TGVQTCALPIFMQITEHSEHDHLKAIIDVLDIEPVLTEELLALGKWLAKTTASLYITTFQAMLPQVLKSKYEKEVVRLSDEALGQPLDRKSTRLNSSHVSISY